MSDTPHYKIVIVGSGPAGMTAAIYNARAGLNPIVFEGIEPGGQLTTTNDVENYPGFAEGIKGPELMDIMREQAKRFGAQFEPVLVDKVDFSERPFTLTVMGKQLKADAVIVSTGATARYLGAKREDEFKGNGVSACAVCDGFFWKDKRVMVVGGGDSAMEEATHLTHFASEVIVVHRRDELRASKIMQKRTLSNPKIKIMWDSVIDEYEGSQQEGVTGVIVKNTKTGDTHSEPIDAVFMGIGHTPNTDLFKDAIETDDKGYIKTKPDSSLTNIPGVFACGDVQDSRYRQAITAAGSGCMAALDAEAFLVEQED